MLDKPSISITAEDDLEATETTWNRFNETSEISQRLLVEHESVSWKWQIRGHYQVTYSPLERRLQTRKSRATERLHDVASVTQQPQGSCLCWNAPDDGSGCASGAWSACASGREAPQEGVRPRRRRCEPRSRAGRQNYETQRNQSDQGQHAVPAMKENPNYENLTSCQTYSLSQLGLSG